MKRKGCSLIIINDRGQVLLFLRDDISEIPYPNMWDIPGGHVEDKETPEQCIVREMKEEMNLDIAGFQLFSVDEFDDRVEYTFWMKSDLNIIDIELTEGQCLRWFSEKETKNTELACGFNRIIEDFFKMAPHLQGPSLLV